MRTFLYGLACALLLMGEWGCSRSGTSQNAATTNSTGPAFTVAESKSSPPARDSLPAKSRAEARIPPSASADAGTTSPPAPNAGVTPESAAPVPSAAEPAAVAAESSNPTGLRRGVPPPSTANNETPSEDAAAESANDRESIAASLAAVRVEPTNKSGTEPGDTIPEIEGKDLDGERFALSDYQGKVLMIDFWGDW